MPKLLYLAPQPRETSAIDNRQDIEQLGYRLSQLGHPARLEIVEKLNPRFADLTFWLEQLQPELVHFSGHGTKLAKMVFVDNKGNRHDVPPDAVAGLFASLRTPVKGLVLNTCYSLPVARKLVKSVDFVVSTATELQDESAIQFAAAFYAFLTMGYSLQAAFDRGETQVRANRKKGQKPPKLLCREGILPEKYVLYPQETIPPTPMPTPTPPGPIRVCVHFCATCPEDARLTEELFTMLKARRLSFWDITQIQLGSKRDAEINFALDRSTHVVLLISADAQANPEWMAILHKAIVRAKSQQAVLLPVHLRPSLDLLELTGIEHFPPGDRALSQATLTKRTELWMKLVKVLELPTTRNPRAD